MPSGTSYTASRRYARKTGKPSAAKSGSKTNKAKSSKGKTANNLSKSLLKKLDERYVEEDEAETKLSPILNTTDWTELNPEDPGSSGATLVNPVTNRAPIAPCSLITNTAGGYAQWAVTGNIFQFGNTLSSDLTAYNAVFNPLFNQEPAFPIKGLSWYPSTTPAVIPIGLNPSRIMDGQYINLRRSTMNVSINMTTVPMTELRSYNMPCQFRVMHVSAKRDNSPAGKTYSPTTSLFLREDGTASGLEDLFDQTSSVTTRITKQQLMKYPLNKKYFRVHSDFGFTLQNPCMAEFPNTPTAVQGALPGATGSLSFPVSKQFTISRSWGSQNKTIMVKDPLGDEWIPKDDNMKDYIIIVATRGLCSRGTTGGYINSPSLGKASGYTTSFFGTTSAKDL